MESAAEDAAATVKVWPTFGSICCRASAAEQPTPIDQWLPPSSSAVADVSSITSRPTQPVRGGGCRRGGIAECLLNPPDGLSTRATSFPPPRGGETAQPAPVGSMIRLKVNTAKTER